MKIAVSIMLITVAGFLSVSTAVRAEMLALVNYETKAEDSIKALRTQSGPAARREGLAVVDVDPGSATLGKWLLDIPLPADLVGHHLYYNRDFSKVYLTALGRSELTVIDLTRKPWRVTAVPVPQCKVLEDMVFSADKKTWWLTCMGSANIIVGDAVSDKPRSAIALPKPYPHGIALHEGIDRILVTSSLSPEFTDLQETITAIEASTGRVLATYKVSKKPSPARVTPEEIFFMPGSNPPVAFVINDTGGTKSTGSIWAALWSPEKQDFEVREMFDFAATEDAICTTMLFNRAADQLYVTTVVPGSLHVFDIAVDPLSLTLRQTIPTAPGAHHLALSKDQRYAVVQNSMVNLPGMNDGSISVIDLVKQEVVAGVDTFKNQGLVHNSILLLPQWHQPMGM